MANQPAHIFKSITLTNFLSFGPEPTKVELSQLNVLIGPNGSGKTNFLQSIKLLRACVTGLNGFLDDGDSFVDIRWSGKSRDKLLAIEAAVTTSEWSNKVTTHRLLVRQDPFEVDSLDIGEEVITEVSAARSPTTLFATKGGKHKTLRKVRIQKEDGAIADEPKEIIEKRLFRDSVLAHSDASDYLEPLRIRYRQVFQFEGDGLQHSSEARRAQKTDIDQTFLARDGSNLANVIEALQHKPAVMNDIMGYVRRFYPKAIRLVPGLVGSKVRLFLEEEGLSKTTPASRLSSGTIAFITLVVMLLHPNPPPLICLEQPEDGLHPDALPLIAELLVSASRRTQLLVTTHSEILVSALSDHPEAILVFEPGVTGTTVRRLDAGELKPWLDKYSLGDLWVSGEIGGVRR